MRHMFLVLFASVMSFNIVSFVISQKAEKDVKRMNTRNVNSKLQEKYKEL